MCNEVKSYETLFPRCVIRQMVYPHFCFDFVSTILTDGHSDRWSNGRMN